MKKTLVALAATTAIAYFSGCEKDDICVDGDTPLLVIEFYDYDSRELDKAVSSLRVVGQDQNVTVNTIADRTDLDSITLPLRTTDTSTLFYFIQQSATNADTQLETGNIDTLTFSYTPQEAFVSRACGYVVHYADLNAALQTGTDNWIKEVEIDSSYVSSTLYTHVKIYH